MKTKKYKNGFTLTELLITLAIIAVLGAVGYPSYMSSVERSHRQAAQSGLTLLGAEMGRAKAVSATNNYANLTQEDSSPIATLFPSQLPIDDDDKTYDITITVNDAANQYTLTATPIEGTLMEGDGAYTLSSTGAKTYNGSSGW